MFGTIYFIFFKSQPNIQEKRTRKKTETKGLSRRNILLKCTQECVLLFFSLVLSVSELG